MSFRKIGIVIAREDGREMPYTASGVYRALHQFRIGNRDEDGERFDWKPASNRRKH